MINSQEVVRPWCYLRALLEPQDLLSKELFHKCLICCFWKQVWLLSYPFLCNTGLWPGEFIMTDSLLQLHFFSVSFPCVVFTSSPNDDLLVDIFLSLSNLNLRKRYNKYSLQSVFTSSEEIVSWKHNKCIKRMNLMQLHIRYISIIYFRFSPSKR